jgi:hypothetical protein
LIFQISKWGKEKNSNFAAEIQSRNGLILFHGDFSGGSVGEGYSGRAFFMPPVQLDDITGATRFHLPESQLNHRLFLSTLPFITRIQKHKQQKRHP